MGAKEGAMRTRILVSMLLAIGGSASAGAPVKMPAYYDGELFTINFTELPAGGESATEQHNGSKNTIYQCDSCPFTFISVLDAIQGDGFNPLWEEVQINFNSGVTPRQFTSDNEVLNAFANNEITLTDTEEMYICAVLGRK
jgi:hypothetical protein